MSRKRLLSPLGQKAVCLLRRHYVFVAMPKATGFRGNWRVPEFVWDYGVVNTHSGARVPGFGRQTFRELKAARLLEPPARFPTRYGQLKGRSYGRPFTEDVYTLNGDGLTAVIVATIINATNLKEEIWQ